MPWLELQLNIAATVQPRVEAALDELGALSVTLMDADADTADEAAVFEPGVGQTPLWQSLVVLALFHADADRGSLVRGLQGMLPELPAARITFREVPDQDWERAWMDRLVPMQFGRRLWIYPSNIEPPGEHASRLLPPPAGGRTGEGVEAPGEYAPRPLPASAGGGGDKCAAPCATRPFGGKTVIVRMDPGLAFGTGTHPTTALCLKWLASLDLSGKSLIDYGCGSGVLAIAALKLGAAWALGVDNDPQALVASHDNAARNGVADRLACCAPETLPRQARCEVLVANILAKPLGELAPRLAALCQPGAAFALSGILAGQERTLLERYEACSFTNLRVTQRNGWLRIDGRRTG